MLGCGEGRVKIGVGRWRGEGWEGGLGAAGKLERLFEVARKHKLLENHNKAYRLTLNMSNSMLSLPQNLGSC